MLRKKLIVIGTAITLAGLLVVAGMGARFAVADKRAATAAGEIRAGFVTLTSAQLAAMLRGKDFYFVNTHTPYEGEIDKTDAFIVFDKVAENLNRLPNKDEKIVLYCQSGRMSEIAARELTRLGYSRVSNLAGGMIAWKNSGYAVIRK